MSFFRNVNVTFPVKKYKKIKKLQRNKSSMINKFFFILLAYNLNKTTDKNDHQISKFKPGEPLVRLARDKKSES